MEARGRPSIGSSRRVALTLKDDTWLLVDRLQRDKLGERLRFIIEEYFKMQHGQTFVVSEEDIRRAKAQAAYDKQEEEWNKEPY